MTLLVALLALGFAALSAWLLWRGLARGEIVGRYGGVYTRADAPIRFWLTVGVNGLTATLFAGVAVVAAWRGLVPPPLAQRESALYPSHALAQNASGLVLLHCTVTETFGVKDCRVASENPPGMGFGASALQVSALYAVPGKDRALAHPGEALNLPIRFKIPPPPARPPAPQGHPP